MILSWLLGVAQADDSAAFRTWAARQEVPETPERAEGYRFAGAWFRDLAAAAEERPGVVSVEILGHTHTGKPIWAFHVRDPMHPPERDVLVFAGIHALEWISTEVAGELLLDLVARPPPGVGVTVIPLLNPDGRAKVEHDLLAGEDHYRRGNNKNVDLNRDFAVNTDSRAVWQAFIPGFYDHSETPLSQPESQALDALAAREVYDRAVSLHAFGGYLYYPWTGRWERPPDHADFTELGSVMEQAQGDHPYRTKQLSRWGFFFRALGSEIDHLYGTYGTRAFLVELTRSGLSLARPSSFWDYFRWYNPRKPDRHVVRGERAVLALIRHPATEGEIENPAGTPRVKED